MIKWTVNADGDTVGALGKWKVFHIHWDIMQSKSQEEPNPYILNAKLPGFKHDLGRFAKVIKAQEFAEKALKIWIKGAGDKMAEYATMLNGKSQYED